MVNSSEDANDVFCEGILVFKLLHDEEVEVVVVMEQAEGSSLNVASSMVLR